MSGLKKVQKNSKTKNYFVNPALRLRVKDGQILAQTSQSSGEFVMNLEVLVLILSVQKNNISQEVKKLLSKTLSDIPSVQETEQILGDLADAGIVSDSQNRFSLQVQDGFGDRWIQWAMIADQQRNQAYEKALRSVVLKGNIVADVGAGCGFLSYISLQAGAKKVFAIEETPMAHKILPLLRDTKVLTATNQCVVFPTNSVHVRLPETCHVVVSELFGNDPFEEGILNTLWEFSQKKPVKNARYIPEKVEVYFEQVDILSHATKDRISALQDQKNESFLAQAKKKLDFSSLSFPIHFQSSDVKRVGRGLRFGELFLNPPSSKTTFHGQKRLKVEETTVPLFITWFRVTLVPGVTISSHPCEVDYCSHWSPIAIPLLKGIDGLRSVDVRFSLNDDRNFLRIVIRNQEEIIASTS